MSESQEMQKLLKDLETQRKNGEITAAEFYKGLLELLMKLKDILVNENVNEAQIKRQIPLILVFLKSQIKELSNRGN